VAGSCFTPGYAQSVAVAGSYAYVAAGTSGLRVINISNPTFPMQAGYYVTPGNARGVAVSGCVAYLIGANYFFTLDISFFAPCPVPRAPESLTIAYLPQSRALRLRWAPVQLDTGGLPIHINRYVVYRSDSVNAALWYSIGVPVPPDTTVFVDTSGVVTRQFYQVRARSD
jgi:hypothetical protein